MFNLKTIGIVITLCAVQVFQGCASMVPLSRQDHPVELVVANYSVDYGRLDTEDSSLISPTGQFIEAVRTIDDLSDNYTAYHTALRASNDTIFSIVDRGLTEGLGVALVKLCDRRPQADGGITVTSSVPPRRHLTRAAQKHGLDRALAVTVSFDYVDVSSSHKLVLGVGTATTEGRPRVTLQVLAVDSSGEVLWRDQIRREAPGTSVISQQWMMGIKVAEAQGATAPYFDLVTEATEALVARHR